MTSSHSGDAATDGGSRRTGEPAEDRAGAVNVHETALCRHLLDTATELFLERGPTAVPLETVAEQAGVPMDTVSERFGSRMELLSAVARRLYLSVFPFEKDPVRPNDLRAFLEAYLAVQGEPKARLLRQLGDLLASDRLDGRDAAYWHVVGEIELRLVAAGLEGVVAHRRSLVIAPALALMARRASFELAMPGDISDFIDAACHLALGDSGDG